MTDFIFTLLTLFILASISVILGAIALTILYCVFEYLMDARKKWMVDKKKG